MSRRAKIGLVVGLLLAYVAVGFFYCGLVSYLAYWRLGLAGEVAYSELYWFTVGEVWPLVAWPYDAVSLFVFQR